MTSKPNRSRRAFTLYELVVVIALFALVGGMVTSFIIFMSNYSNTGERQAQRVSELTELRAQTDAWFSYADSSGSPVTLGGNAAARAGGMSITVTQQEDGCTFVFDYGTSESERTQTLTFENSYTMRIYAAAAATAENTGSLIRFTVQMRVQGGLYVCEISADAE